MTSGRRYAHDWEVLARTEPLFAVLTDTRYLSERLTPEHERQFWRSGESYVEALADLWRTRFSCTLRPERALDFGCGVGRLLLPIARLSGTAVGVDVSPTMRGLARSACERAGVSNVSFAASVPSDTDFDYANSTLVFQHMPVQVGLDALDKILGRLRPNGLLSLQLLFSRPHNGPGYRICRWLYANIQPLRGLVNLLRRKPYHAPYMQMNAYPLNEVLMRFERNGIHDAYFCLSDDGGFEGALILARKSSDPVGRK